MKKNLRRDQIGFVNAPAAPEEHADDINEGIATDGSARQQRCDDVTALVMELVEGLPEKSETIFAAWSDRSGRRGGQR